MSVRNMKTEVKLVKIWIKSGMKWTILKNKKEQQNFPSTIHAQSNQNKNKRG